MKKTTFLKSLLLAAALCVGTMNASANDSFGSLEQGWWKNFSQTYTLEGYGKFHFQFTTTNVATDAWKTWLLVATNGNDSHGGGGTEYFAWRGDGYAWGQGKNSDQASDENADGDPTHLVCSNTYATSNPSGAGLTKAMNDATVDMVVTRTSTNIYAEASVTPTLAGENPFTMSFSYLFGNATSENIGLFFEVENSTMDISTAENYYGVTRYSQNYEDATTFANGWSTSRDSWSQGNGNGGKVFQVDPSNATTYTLSFANNNYFKTVTDYIFSFEYAFSSGNGNAGASSLVIKDTEGNTLFTLSNSGNWSETCDGTYGEKTITEVYHAPYNSLADAIYATFTLCANAEDGVVLSISGSKKNILNNKKYKDVGVINPIYSVKIADFAKIGSIELNAAKGASHYAFDNMILKEHTATAVAEDPAFAFNRVSGENRVYTITNPNGEGTLYYTTATAAEAPAVGDAAYSSSTESSVDVPFGTGTYYAYVVLADGTTTSAVISQAVTGGAIQLVKPYYTIVSYDASTANTTVTLNTNVSGLLGTPTATIKYTIDEGEVQSTTNGGTVLVADGSTIAFYAEAEGYSTSESVSVTATAPNANPELWSETYNGRVSSDKGFTLGTDIIATENQNNYYYLYYDGTTQLSDKLLANGVYSNNMLRSNGYYSGQNASLAIYGLKEGDYVTFTGAYGNGAFGISANTTDFEADAWHTINGSKYCYTVKRNCSARFTLDRYGYLKSITVQRALATRGAEVSEFGYATFAADVALDLSTLTDGFNAYFASSLSNGKVMMTKANGEKIAAGEGLFIEGNGAFTISETREATADVDNYLVGGDDVENGVAKEDGFDKYVLGEDGESLSFFLIDDEYPATVPTNKAYLKVPASAPASAQDARLRIVFGEDATGISNLVSSENSTDSYFNLSGQRVAAPQKGLYIVNGKKVIIK